MQKTAEAFAWLIQASTHVYEKKWGFFGLFAVVFIGTVSLLARFDLLPNPLKMQALESVPVVALTASPVQEATTTQISVEDPVKITIEKIKLSATIANPSTTNATVLDDFLLSGAVRYPTSAKLGEAGNVVLFGHSSYLPIVGNQAYKTFNGIQKLVAGDRIVVYSADTAYTYAVRNVAKESAASDAGIELATSGRVLTLATCNSFGAKSDRFIVTADFVESHSISNE